jgi:hypothetical protein
MDRTRYQFGSVTLKKRAKGADVWEFRYYETQADGTRKRKATFIGTTNQYKNKSEARVAVEALLLKLNEEKLALENIGALLRFSLHLRRFPACRSIVRHRLGT